MEEILGYLRYLGVSKGYLGIWVVRVLSDRVGLASGAASIKLSVPVLGEPILTTVLKLVEHFETNFCAFDLLASL